MKDGGQISSRGLQEPRTAQCLSARTCRQSATDKRYQLWTLEGQRAIADNLVAGGGDRQQFFREGLSGITGLAVSVEDCRRRPAAKSGDDPGGHRALAAEG